MNLQNISLISFGYNEKQFLDKIAENLKKEFSCEIRIIEGHLDLSEFYDPARRQYNADELLMEIDSRFGSEEYKTIGLLNVDIFIPIFTYIFGQAFLKGRTGIVSSYRLSNERYGLEQNQNIVLDRVSKEIIHELGHTFGLIHCHNPDCVMRSGTYVEDIDQKSSNLCLQCKKKTK